jgi:pimeloyl-ACP methyl ester carboxylesterase
MTTTETSQATALTAPDVERAFAQPHAYLALGGGRLAYWRFGAGPDVVLIHGWPLHAATFRHIIPGLARSFTLHLFDRPGTGHTEWTGPSDFAAQVQTVRHLIDKLGLRDHAILAHDVGGAIARHAIADDSRVRALVLGNTEIPGHHAWLVEIYGAAFKVPGMSRLLLAAMRIPAVRRSFLGFGGCFSDPAYVDGDFGQRFIQPLIHSRRVAEGHVAFLRDFDFGLVQDLGAVHARIQAPVLCIWGPEDPFFPIAKTRRILGQFAGGAELVEIPGAKLFAHEDHPEAFVAHAAPFLARHLHASPSSRGEPAQERPVPGNAARP